jgi:hypothetical protein
VDIIAVRRGGSVVAMRGEGGERLLLCGGGAYIGHRAYLYISIHIRPSPGFGAVSVSIKGEIL